MAELCGTQGPLCAEYPEDAEQQPLSFYFITRQDAPEEVAQCWWDFRKLCLDCKGATATLHIHTTNTIHMKIPAALSRIWDCKSARSKGFLILR
jgi:hypothetical protein